MYELLVRSMTIRVPVMNQSKRSRGPAGAPPPQRGPDDMDVDDLAVQFNQAIGVDDDEDEYEQGQRRGLGPLQRNVTVQVTAMLKRCRNPFDEPDPEERPARIPVPPSQLVAPPAPNRRRARDASEDAKADDDEERPAQRLRQAPRPFRAVVPRGPRPLVGPMEVEAPVVNRDRRGRPDEKAPEEKTSLTEMLERSNKKPHLTYTAALNPLLTRYKNLYGHRTRDAFGLVEPWGGLVGVVGTPERLSSGAFDQRFYDLFRLGTDLCGRLEQTAMIHTAQQVLASFFAVNRHDCYVGVENWYAGIPDLVFCTPRDEQNAAVVPDPRTRLFNSSLLDGICAILGPLPVRDNGRPVRPPPTNMDFLIRAFLRTERPFYVFRFIWLRLLNDERQACYQPMIHYMTDYAERNVLDDRAAVMRRCRLIMEGELADFGLEA